MILLADWLTSTTGEPIIFSTPDAAWNFLASVNYDAPCLSDRRITDWYPGYTPANGFVPGFRWKWDGGSDCEKDAFFHYWNEMKERCERYDK